MCLLSSAISDVRIQFWQRKSAKETHQKMWVWWLSSKVYLWVVRTSTSGYYYDVNGCQICWYVNIRESVFGSKSLSTFIFYSKPLTDSLIESHSQVCKKVYMRAFIKRSPNFKNSLKTYIWCYIPAALLQNITHKSDF